MFADLLVGLRVDVDVADPMALLGCRDERLALVVASGAGGVLRACVVADFPGYCFDGNGGIDMEQGCCDGFLGCDAPRCVGRAREHQQDGGDQADHRQQDQAILLALALGWPWLAGLACGSAGAVSARFLALRDYLQDVFPDEGGDVLAAAMTRSLSRGLRAIPIWVVLLRLLSRTILGVTIASVSS